MHVHVYARRHSPGLEAYVLHQIDAVLGTFHDRVDRVSVHLLDEDDERHGSGKVCAIDIKLIPQGQLHVRAKNGTIHAAVAKAVDQVESVLAESVNEEYHAHGLRRHSDQEVARNASGHLDAQIA